MRIVFSELKGIKYCVPGTPPQNLTVMNTCPHLPEHVRQAILVLVDNSADIDPRLRPGHNPDSLQGSS
jgi:hypothetical protein